MMVMRRTPFVANKKRNRRDPGNIQGVVPRGLQGGKTERTKPVIQLLNDADNDSSSPNTDALGERRTTHKSAGHTMGLARKGEPADGGLLRR
jgi:hypothetical protein